jgi:hypothetical protein
LCSPLFRRTSGIVSGILSAIVSGIVGTSVSGDRQRSLCGSVCPIDR